MPFRQPGQPPGQPAQRGPAHAPAWPYLPPPLCWCGPAVVDLRYGGAVLIGR